jgi:hypothetical protein
MTLLRKLNARTQQCALAQLRTPYLSGVPELVRTVSAATCERSERVRTTAMSTTMSTATRERSERVRTTTMSAAAAAVLSTKEGAGHSRNSAVFTTPCELAQGA